jgi:hypothetical protein
MAEVEQSSFCPYRGKALRAAESRSISRKSERSGLGPNGSSSNERKFIIIGERSGRATEASEARHPRNWIEDNAIQVSGSDSAA